MNATHLHSFIGRQGMLGGVVGQVRVAVIVTDARIAYGNVHLLITPKAGEGTAWVSADRVQLD